MHERFIVRMEVALEKVRSSCEKRRCKKEVIDRRVGRIKTKNSRGAGLFDIKVVESEVVSASPETYPTICVA